MADSDKGNIGSGADRRVSERLTVDLQARVDLDGRDPRSAQIMDFCVGGLFLSVQGQEDDYLVMAARQIGRDDRLRVTFDADPGDGLRTFTITVKVARLFLGGMGVAFDPPDSAAIQALQSVAERSRAAARQEGSMASTPQGSSDAGPLIAELQQSLERWLRESLDATFKRASDDLFVEARDATSNDVQRQAMDALKDVERIHPAVRDATSQRVLRAFERLSGVGSSSLATIMDEADDADSARGGGLALIDSGSFDDWVTTKNIITRHEPVLRESAYALSRRLEVIAGKNIDELANPLGLQQLGGAFNEAMQNLGLERRPRKAIYQAVEDSLVPALGKLHKQLNTLLIDKGVLPEVERPSHGSSKLPRSPRAAPAAAPPAESPENEQESESVAADAPPVDSPHPSQHADAPARRSPGNAGGQTSSGQAQPAQHGGGVNPWAAAPIDDAGDAAPHTMHSGASAASPAPAGGAYPPAAEGSATAPGVANPPASGGAPQAFQPTYHSPIQSAVSQVGMQRAYQAARSLMGMQRAMTAGATMAGVQQAPASTPAQQASGPSHALLDALSKMQSSAEFNQGIASQSPQSSQLKERLRSALQSSGVSLGAEESEAVDVLGDLFEAVLADPLIQSNIKPRIERLSVPLLRTAMRDQGFFEEEAHPARQVVNRLGMLGLPDALASGETGDSLQSSVDPILDRLLADPQGGPEVFEAALPELDGLIERQNERFASNVRQIVSERERQQTMLAARRTGDTNVARRIPAELEPWFKRTERLRIGDSVTFRAGSANPQTQTLAWVADDHETFVFADRDGHESGAVSQQELALDMLRGSAKVADSDDVPPMDRGVYQMLHKIHSSLAEEGRRDSVTGLIPLSVFETRVEEAIARAQRRGSRHALLALNLDHFAAINKNCGRDAGDSLLRKLSRLLNRQIAEQGCLMRAFADEFLILLEDHPLQDARRFAERQCRAIENSRVVFAGEQYPITASIGMVPVTRAGESAATVIENARAALAGAKRRGGNQLRIFDPDEDELPMRDARPADKGEEHGKDDGNEASETPPRTQDSDDGHGDGLVGMIDAGRIVLQRQIVIPLVEGGEYKSHYEVLLGVRDAQGQVVAVSDDLLTEAERSERMADVDRWVIHTALQWMAANRREVVRSGGYVMNLSTAAFADDSLLEFVVKELTESTVPPAKVIFAITESVAIDRLSSAVGFIRALRDYGCRFSIDDFGAGQATFAYLKTLPVDFVNIDGLFVRDLADNDNDYAMVKSINEIAHLMGKPTIAKFADSEATVARLKELGVDFSQGGALGERETLQ